MQAMIMTVPPTSDTTESILATRPRRTAPSRFPCSRLFLDWKKKSGFVLLDSGWMVDGSVKVSNASSYHDGVDESHYVYGPHGAEARQHRQEEVVFHFGPVQRWICGDARVARK